MTRWSRRSVLGAGSAFVASGLLAPIGASVASAQSSDGTVPAADGWSSYHGGPGNTASVPADEPIPEPGAVAWSYGEEGDIAVVDGTVYLRTSNEVHAIDDETGEALWVGGEIGADGTPAVAGESVFVGGEQLTALESDTGDVRWREQFDDGATVPDPTVAYELVYVVVEDTLYAFDAADGSIAWERSTVQLETATDSEELPFEPIPVAAANELVYAAVGDAGFVALDATTGEREWSHWWEYSSDPHGYLVATGEHLYTGDISDAAENPVLDAKTGERVANISFRFPLAVTDDVRARTNRHSMQVTHYETDKSWSIGGSVDQWGRPVIVGETVVVPSHLMADEPAIFAFDIADGSRRWAFGVGEFDINTLDELNWPSDSFVTTEETVYITSPNQVVAIRPSNGEERETDSTDAEDENAGPDGSGENATDERVDGGANGDNGTDDEVTDLEDIIESETETTGSENASGPTNASNRSSGTAANGSEGGITGGDESANESPPASSNASGEGGANGSNGGDGVGAASDDTPGFTGGAGLVGGGLALEWLRRRSRTDDSTAETERAANSDD
ncbi:PQQ-binding-like beta-propeller repeat protein [Halostagnicola kamekurae]|uniref:PQQ-like domain-containing protein n=1 Tax=Halostagnicola kamekurae TaxID=619731 RepID=A0A1I6QLB3_9EURY|nr:PQQ-binding-like beta-propeller repeat protein [Halostagnicola kamekurae]SFS53239.1 PQQ-like domain-containing protein [Halostagnicola kamekurae]